MRTTTVSKVLILASLLAAASYTVSTLVSMPRAVASPLPAAQAATGSTVQTVILSAKRLTPAEKVRIDEIENLLSGQNALLPKKAGKILT